VAPFIADADEPQQKTGGQAPFPGVTLAALNESTIGK